jgi:hypothetical protein
MDGLENQDQHYIIQVIFSKRILQGGVRDRQTCEASHLSCVKGHHGTRRE